MSETDPRKTLRMAVALLACLAIIAVLSFSSGAVGDGPSAAEKSQKTATADPDPLTAPGGERTSMPRGGARGAAVIERQNMAPDGLLQLPPSASSALVFDLEKNRMHVFHRSAEELTKVGDYFVAVGKKGLNKYREGDEKTPIGIYFTTRYIPGSEIPAIYGAGAFPLDYPNTWDRRLGRTGSGIWIHGTDKDDESLLPLSSRGCLTLRDGDFTNITSTIEIGRTPVIVHREAKWVLESELASKRLLLSTAVETWRRDWESLDTERYLRHYSKSFRTDTMNLKAWKAHKRRVNRSKTFIKVKIEEVGIYGYPGEKNLFMTTFKQSYRSNNFRGERWKRQFWRCEIGECRIVHEGDL